MQRNFLNRLLLENYELYFSVSGKGFNYRVYIKRTPHILLFINGSINESVNRSETSNDKIISE